MAYTFGSAAANASNAGTVTISPATGALVVIFSCTSGGGGTPTVTFSDNSSSTWANASNNVVDSNGLHYSCGYCLSALAGVTTITATYNGGAPGTCNLVAVTYTGLSSPSFVAINVPNVQASPGTGTNAVTTASLATGSISALLIGFSVDNNGNASLSPGTGFTQRYQNNPNIGQGLFIEDPGTEVTGSQVATWTAATHSTDTYISLAVAFADNSVPPNSATIAWVS
jgi:hypothetical protein